MHIKQTLGWSDYALLDSGNGRRLERFGSYTLNRPDPQALWLQKLPNTEWEKADAIFRKTDSGEEKWKKIPDFPQKWHLAYKDVSFYAKLAPFKHTGIFPEQHVQWDYLDSLISSSKKKVRVLNLFAYTGIASLIAAAKGATVTHVDASYPAIGWARENQALSNLTDKPIRFILDDALVFCEREVRRGNTYDIIIMDPPVYGHGPKGEKWDFPKSFPTLLNACKKLLPPDALCLLINAYAISSSALMLQNMLQDLSLGGKIEVGELALQEQTGKRLLSTGIYAQWSND
jgi:23S rRNA (cytosine1962-C5)-methyltransferase